MIQFFVKRLTALVATIIVLTAALFALQKATHADLAIAYLGRNADPSQLAAVRKQLGYNHSVVVQFFDYLSGLLHGNLQTSLSSHRPVSTEIGQYLPPTLELMFFVVVFAVIAGMVLGTISALRWPGAGVLRLIMLSGASAPSFLLALLALIFFYHRLGWLPAGGQTSLASVPTTPTGFFVINCLVHGNFPALWDVLQHLVLPVICLGLGPAVAIGRVLRGSLLSVLHADHIRTARSKGLREWTVVYRHALRNAANSALQMTGLQIGFLFAGVVVIEQTFSWPGIGNYTAEAIMNSDFPAIIGVSLVGGILFVVVNALVDIAQAWADPRIALR